MVLCTTKVKYVASVGSYCFQLLWIKLQLENFGVVFDTIPLLSNNNSALNMAKNLVHHKRTKHIDVRHDILRDNEEKWNINLYEFLERL